MSIEIELGELNFQARRQNVLLEAILYQLNLLSHATAQTYAKTHGKEVADLLRETSLRELQTLMRRYIGTFGAPEALSLLQQYSAERVSEIPRTRRKEFKSHVLALLSAEEKQVITEKTHVRETQ